MSDVPGVSPAAGEIYAGEIRHAETPAVRVFVASRVRLYRDALVEILARDDRLEVVGAAGCREEILAQVAEAKPDVVVLGPAAAEGMGTIREVVGSGPGIKVVALGWPNDEQDVMACAEAGASGFVTADDAIADLVVTILSAAQGELVCSPQTAGSLLRRVNAIAAERRQGSAERQLTRRELEVAGLLDEGLSNRQIADRLCLELPIVKHHVHHIPHKLGVASRSEAVAHLRQLGTARDVS